MKAFIGLSGGMDSTILLAKLIAEGYAVNAYFFNYGSKHNPREFIAATNVAKRYGVPLTGVDMRGILATSTSGLTSPDIAVPEGHYESESMKANVVPGRNTLFIATLLSKAQAAGGGKIFLGCHFGDRAIYPDCRREYLVNLREAISYASEWKVELQFPYVTETKSEMLLKTKDLNIPFHLTSSCYKGGELPCGKCGACQERLEAFRLAGMEDPLEYAK
jgi:7-cyano-7-deazaguanine synthase